MLVVGGVEVGQIDRAGLERGGVGVGLEDLERTFEAAQDRGLEADRATDPLERVGAGAAELADPRLPVLVKAFEDAGGVGVDRGCANQGGEEEIAEVDRRRVDELPIGVEPVAVGARVEHPVVGRDVFLVVRGIHLRDESAGGSRQRDAVVEIGDDIGERRQIDIAAVGKEAAAGDAGVRFEIVGDDVGGVRLHEAGNDPRSAEEIEERDPFPTEPVLDLPDGGFDRPEKRPLVPEAGDQLLREEVGVLAAVAVSHRPSPAVP